MKKRLLERMITCVILVAMLVSSLPISVFANLSADLLESNGTTITLDKQFLEFEEFGQTKKLTATVTPEGTEDEIVWETSNPDNVKVSNDGDVAWLSSTEPVIITASLKSNPEIKAQCFASFEGDVNDAEANNAHPQSDIQDIANDNNAHPEEDNNAEENIVPSQAENMDNEPISRGVYIAAVQSINLLQSVVEPMVTQGINFTAVLKLDGTVWTVGDNTAGQLGDGTNVARTTLEQVKGPGGSGFLTDIVQISAGQEFVIALKSDGTVWAWGKNDYGQLGDNTTANSIYPKQVLGLLDGKSISYVTAGPLNSGVIDENGYVYLWGYNGYGQLGTNNRTTPQRLPVQPFNFGGTTGQMQGVTEIALGVDHSVFLKEDGTVWTMGRNYAGEIGNTSLAVNTAANTGTLVALQVMAPGATAGQFLGVNTPKIASIAAGYFTSGAVDENGNAYMWGKASNSVLGQNNTTNQTRPVVVKDTNGTNNLANVKKLRINATATEGTAIALTTNGKVYTWGLNNNGQLGDGTTTAKSLPIQPLDATGGTAKFNNAIGISISNAYQGGYSSSVLTADGAIYVFGLNNSGQFGLVDKTNRTIPTQVQPSKMENIAGQLNLNVNGSATLSMKFTNAFNVYGATQSPLTYTYESKDVNVATVTSGGLVTAKKVGWTSIKVTQTHTGVVEFVPVYVTSNEIQPKIVQGIDFTAVLKADGTVWTVGNNNYGQLGDGTTLPREIFSQVKGENGEGYLTNVKDIKAGKGHIVALRTDGTVWTWGYNEYGQLGDNATINSVYPKKVEGSLTRKNN